MILENYEEFIEYISDEFENADDITVVCDYNLADLLNYYFGDKEYTDYKGIDLQSDVNEYFVTKFGNEFFCITPIKTEDKIKTVTSDYFIIDNNILERNPTLFNHLEGSFDEDFKVEVIDYEEENDDKIDDCFEYDECPNCYDEGINEIDIEEELACLEIADLVEEYTQLILDNDCKEEAIAHALCEVIGKTLMDFELYAIEEE